ncbi:MAG: hypothetical protein ACFFDN_00890 [Candidatus Hodarchaeota archaeon]
MGVNLGPNPIWNFRDLLGRPASNGKLLTRKASDHDTGKVTYKDVEATEAWPVDIVLTAAGTTPGALYFADDEYYYLEVQDTYGAEIWSVDNYNPAEVKPEPAVEEELNTNYFFNPQFRFYAQQLFETDDLPANTDIEIAPGGWFFRRNNISSNSIVEFNLFPVDQGEVQYNPKYYLNFKSVSIGSGELEKDIFFRVNDVQNFGDQEFTFAVFGRSAASNQIEFLIRRIYGTGGSTTTYQPIATISLTPTFERHIVNFEVDDLTAKNIGDPPTSIDFIFRAPLNTPVNFDLVNFQINLGDTLRDFDYYSYDMEKVRLAAYPLPVPTKADVGGTLMYTGHNYEFQHFTGRISISSGGAPLLGGNPHPLYVLADGATYKSYEYVPNTEDSIKYERLYDYYENEDPTNNGNYYGYGEDGFKPMIYDNIISFACTKNQTAIPAWSDYNTGFTFENARTGATTEFSIDEAFFVKSWYPWIIHSEGTAPATVQENNTNRILGRFRITNDDTGAAAASTNGNITNNVTAYTNVSGSSTYQQVTDFEIGRAGATKDKPTLRYITYNTPTTAYAIVFKVENAGIVPSTGRTNIFVDIDENDSEIDIALKCVAKLNSGSYGVTAEIPLKLEAIYTNYGTIDAPFNNFASGATVCSSNLGASDWAPTVRIEAIDSDFIAAGDYFGFSTTTTSYLIWFRKDGSGTVPPVGTIKLVADIKSGDSSFEVAKAIKDAVLGRDLKRIITVAASALTGGEYFNIENSTEKFTPYIILDGAGEDPDVSGAPGVPIPITGSDDDHLVAEKVSKAISKIFFQVPDYRGLFLQGNDETGIYDKEANFRFSSGSEQNRLGVGTLQLDANKSHTHGLSQSSNVPAENAQYLPSSNAYVPADALLVHTIDTDGNPNTRPVNRTVNFYIKI